MRAASLIAALVACGSAARAAEPIEGLWLLQDRSAVVRIARCGQRMCGWIERVLERGPNVPARDIHNPDPRLRNRPIVGLPIILGMRGSGGEWTGGRGYEPRRGRSFTSSLRLNADGTATHRGCIGLVLCRRHRWTRAR